MSSENTKTGSAVAGDRASVVVLKGAQSTPLPTSPGAGGASVTATTRVATSVANQMALALNLARIGGSLFNNSAVANLAIKYGVTASITAGAESFRTILPPLGRHQIESGYTGQIDIISDAADAAGETLVNEDT